VLLAQAREEGEPVQTRDANVDDRQVGTVLEYQGEGGLAVAGLAHDDEATGVAERLDDSGPVQRMVVDDDAAIIAAVIGMAEGLGLRVVAEGVETEGHVAHLRALGCEFAQGFRFSRPCPPAATSALLGAPSAGFVSRRLGSASC
jgi:hypothetical protein